ncbi:hypothetical protein [Paracoccus sp. (in: a-proteobacteria)]|uniref:hypothetical protein n=1 Tax=Paracoccus sp. TaxID=267 RepID=UPI00396CCC34
MSRLLTRQISQTRTALLRGDIQGALGCLDEMTAQVARHGIDDATRERLEPALTDLRELAQASLQGARQAAEQVRAIVQAARSLQTYDSRGHRLVTATQAASPQRF